MFSTIVMQLHWIVKGQIISTCSVKFRLGVEGCSYSVFWEDMLSSAVVSNCFEVPVALKEIL